MAQPRILDGAALHAAIAVLVAGCAVACGGRADNDAAPDGSGGSTGGSSTEPSGGRSIAGGSHASGGVSSAGQGQGGQVPMMVCEGNAPSLVQGLSPADPVEYLALYEATQFGPQDPVMKTLIGEQGTECGGAVLDPEGCEQAVAAVLSALSTDTGLDRSGQVVTKMHYVWTRAEDAAAISTHEDLLSFLGTIDTANEAAVLFWLADRYVTCDSLRQDAEGYFGRAQRTIADCPIVEQAVEVRVSPEGAITEKEVGDPIESGGCVGRRPDGLAPPGAVEASSDLGCYFAELAHLELAAVTAFELLGSELLAHAAPPRLVERCRVAARDEVRHATAMAGLARRFGAVPPPVRVAPRGCRSLLEMALENAREGVVRELYGAAAAEWQAQHARDAETRCVFRRIAREEAEHAWLSLELEGWLASQLTEPQRQLVSHEKERAYRELMAELAAVHSPELREVAGVPRPVEAMRLLEMVASVSRDVGTRLALAESGIHSAPDSVCALGSALLPSS